MIGMAVLLFVRPIVRHPDRFAQGDERADGRMENTYTGRERIEVRTLALLGHHLGSGPQDGQAVR